MLHGGRQGLSEAQRYLADYDGILAAAPAINWQKFIPAEFWPQLVMLVSGNFLPQCKFAAFQAAAIQACDRAGDGVADGVIGDPFALQFDPSLLVGTGTPCGTISAADANVVAKIVQGPRAANGDFLWFGLTWGSSFSGLANTTATGGAPFPIALAHLGTPGAAEPARSHWNVGLDDHDARSVRPAVPAVGRDVLRRHRHRRSRPERIQEGRR